MILNIAIFLTILIFVLGYASSIFSKWSKEDKRKRAYEQNMSDIDPITKDYTSKYDGMRYYKEGSRITRDDDRRFSSVPVKRYKEQRDEQREELKKEGKTVDVSDDWGVDEAEHDVLYDGHDRYIVRMTLSVSSLAKLKSFADKWNMTRLDVINKIVSENIPNDDNFKFHLDFDYEKYYGKDKDGNYSCYQDEEKRMVYLALTKKTIQILSRHVYCEFRSGSCMISRAGTVDILVHNYLK